MVIQARLAVWQYNSLPRQAELCSCPDHYGCHRLSTMIATSLSRKSTKQPLLADLGALIYQGSQAWYNSPKSIEDLANRFHAGEKGM